MAGALGRRDLGTIPHQLAAQARRDRLHRSRAGPAVGELQVRAQEPPGNTTGEAQIWTRKPAGADVAAAAARRVGAPVHARSLPTDQPPGPGPPGASET